MAPFFDHNSRTDSHKTLKFGSFLCKTHPKVMMYKMLGFIRIRCSSRVQATKSVLFRPSGKVEYDNSSSLAEWMWTICNKCPCFYVVLGFCELCCVCSKKDRKKSRWFEHNCEFYDRFTDTILPRRKADFLMQILILSPKTARSEKFQRQFYIHIQSGESRDFEKTCCKLL